MIGLTNPQTEFTDKRPTNYSVWHRYPTLPRWCYQTDGDWFEQRVRNGKLQSVAYVETIQITSLDNVDMDKTIRRIQGQRTDNNGYVPFRSKVSLCLEIQERMEVPAYVVWHNAECTDFLVLRITETSARRMSGREYIEWIKRL